MNNVGASIASQQAAQAAIAASRAEDSRCKVTIETFDSFKATVPEMQNYATCVQRIHPDEYIPTGGEGALGWALIAWLILWFLYAIAYPRDLVDRALGFVLFSFAAACVVGLIGLAIWLINLN